MSLVQSTTDSNSTMYIFILIYYNTYCLFNYAFTTVTHCFIVGLFDKQRLENAIEGRVPGLFLYNIMTLTCGDKENQDKPQIWQPRFIPEKL
jgi:hypothetical protein